MKIGKATRPSGGVSEMVKTAGETGVDMITDLINQIFVERVIAAEWELNTIVNCCIGKWASLEKWHYRGLKLTDQILKMVERYMQKLKRQQVVSYHDVELHTPFLSWDSYRKHLVEKNNLYFAFVGWGGVGGGVGGLTSQPPTKSSKRGRGAASWQDLNFERGLLEKRGVTFLGGGVAILQKKKKKKKKKEKNWNLKYLMTKKFINKNIVLCHN